MIYENEVFNTDFYSDTRNKYKACYETHKALPIVVGDKTYNVYGGSCSRPVHTDADVYIGLDHTMITSKNKFPWNVGNEVQFLITDMSVPKSISEFKKMIHWIQLQLTANHKVHIGCIGGHGRTGLVMSALVKVMTGNENAISYVRANYCKKAVESKAQIDFLEKHFNIIPVESTKDFGYYLNSVNKPAKRYSTKKVRSTSNTSMDDTKMYKPSKSKLSIW